jgi:hypothetical protein
MKLVEALTLTVVNNGHSLRARQGMVIFVPAGDADDPTRKIEEMDAVADFLQGCGVRLLS